jgi:UDP-glucose 4-epimerase
VIRRVAVFGAGGFIGRQLTAALCRRGVLVAGYGRRHELRCWDQPAAPDAVFYLASSITPALAEAQPELVTVDQLRFVELLRCVSRSARPPAVLLTSSAGTVYDPDLPGPYGEQAPTRATNRYGAAKLELERLLRETAGSVPGVVLRLSNVYGPGQRVDKSQGVLAHWLAAVAAGEPVGVIGDPDTTRDYVYIDDVVDCLLRAAARPSTPDHAEPMVLNVASGVSTSLGDLLSIVELVVGRELTVRRLPARAVDRREVRLDVRRAAAELGWRPQTSLMDGVRAMWWSLKPENQRWLTAPAQ